jgi:hypothetical protein
MGAVAQEICFAKPTPPATCDAVYSNQCVREGYDCGFQTVGDEACGPDPAMPGGCCYLVVGSCPVGRPFLVDGVARLAALEPGFGWTDALAPSVSSLDPETRRALADFWGREGLNEHASIASFARFVLQLLSVGAPAELVRAGQRALGEELDHATLSFGFARAYSGESMAPTPLDVSGGFDQAFDPIAIAVAVAREGCIAESVAALQILSARDAATDPVVKTVLGRIGEQEIDHALLSWRYLRWALDQGDSALHEAVAAVFARAEDHVGLGVTTALAGDAKAMREHGCLPIDERRSLALQVLADVVRPSARALLDATRPLPSHVEIGIDQLGAGAPKNTRATIPEIAVGCPDGGAARDTSA